jgi:hypothetical protein
MKTAQALDIHALEKMRLSYAYAYEEAPITLPFSPVPAEKGGARGSEASKRFPED